MSCDSPIAICGMNATCGFSSACVPSPFVTQLPDHLPHSQTYECILLYLYANSHFFSGLLIATNCVIAGLPWSAAHGRDNGSNCLLWGCLVVAIWHHRCCYTYCYIVRERRREEWLALLRRRKGNIDGSPHQEAKILKCHFTHVNKFIFDYHYI